MTNTMDTIAKKRAILVMILAFFKLNTGSFVIVSYSLKVCFSFFLLILDLPNQIYSLFCRNLQK